MEVQKGYVVKSMMDGPLKVFAGNEAKQRAEKYALELENRYKYDDDTFWSIPIEVEIE